MPVINVGDAAALTAALRTAQSGDTIALAGGDYAAISIRKVHIDNLTITSQAGSQASIHGLGVDESSGITFRNITLVSDPDGGAHPNVVSDSQDIHFDQIRVHGSLNDNPNDDTGGLQFRDSSDVSVTNSEFEELYWGVSHLNDTRVTISGNEFHDLRTDGVRGGGSSYVTITDNSFRDFFINTGDHGDVIQFWTTNTTTSAHDILVENNVFVRGTGYYVQGIALRDEVGTLPYQHVEIRGNLILGSTFNGISVTHGNDVIVADNVVQGYTDQASYIRVFSSDGLTLSNNVSQVVKAVDSQNVNDFGNQVVSAVGDGGAATLAQWTTAHMRSNAGTTDDDVILGGQSGSYLRGDAGNDLLKGGGGFDDINGNQGADTAFGGGGDDWVVGGKYNDSLSGDAGADLVYGNLGADSCYGGDGNDTIRGGQDNDVLNGGSGADYLSGDKGDDTMTGGAGADIFHSFTDAGVDRVTDFNAAEGDRVQLDAGTVYSISQQGADTVIDMAGGGHLVLAGVQFAALPDGWLFT